MSTPRDPGGRDWPAPYERAPRDRVALDYQAAANVSAGAGSAIAAATWTSIGSAQSFEVRGRSSIIEIMVGGIVIGVGNASATGIGSRLLIDGAVAGDLGGDISPASGQGNFLSGAPTVTKTGLAVGAHTTQVQLYSSLAGTYFCRPATAPNTESLSIRVVERRMPS